MDNNIRLLTPFAAIPFFLYFLLTTQAQSPCEDDDKFLACRNEPSCGSLTNMSYPFWSSAVNRTNYCGRDGFELKCEPHEPHPLIQISSQYFWVPFINPLVYTMRIVRIDMASGDICSWKRDQMTDISLSTNLFRFARTVRNFTFFYGCQTEIPTKQNISCGNERESDEFVIYVEDNLLSTYPYLENCSFRIQVPMSGYSDAMRPGDEDALKRALLVGFDVEYYADGELCRNCIKSNGTCGSEADDYTKFSCHGRSGRDALTCQRSHPWNWKRKSIVAVVSVAITLLIVIIAIYFYRRRKKNHYAKSYVQSGTIYSDSSLKDDPEKGSKYFGAHIFTYSELEEATDNFDSAKELGDGGFGTVYFGKLRDGRCVAVKRLYENNCRRVEQFMNEVEILTRLRHPNLVSLYGCTSRHSRELLLVYEYIPNGTVADHLHGERARPGALPWHIRMNIAIETASALAYLHASEIIHRDVKTNNILLDNNFCVKVADFGLSRLFPNDVTHISTAPQGTPGYVDPEYYECYQLTKQSDVYSFGVVLIELISSMPAVDITRHRHEINLSNMAINKIQNRKLHELVDPTLGFDSDFEVKRMINAVAELAFQCLQSLKDMRPLMGEVLDKLADIQSDGRTKIKAEEMDISADDAVPLKNEPPPLSPDSNLRSTSTTPNTSA